jgi:flagellar motility protein MotE (MotC chaperone)
LTERIEAETGEKKQKLTEMRDRLLKITREIDLQVKKHMEETEKLLNSILDENNLEEAISKHLPELD